MLLLNLRPNLLFYLSFNWIIDVVPYQIEWDNIIVANLRTVMMGVGHLVELSGRGESASGVEGLVVVGHTHQSQRLVLQQLVFQQLVLQQLVFNS